METQICKSCKEEKDKSKFNSRLLKNGEIYFKKTCSKCINLKWKIKNPLKYKEVQKASYIQRKKDFVHKREQLFIHVNQFVCQRCFNDDKRVLQFHHREGTVKSFPLDLTRSLKNLKQEAEKCDVLCANCHIIIHYELRNEKNKK